MDKPLEAWRELVLVNHFLFLEADERERATRLSFLFLSVARL